MPDKSKQTRTNQIKPGGSAPVKAPSYESVKMSGSKQGTEKVSRPRNG